MLSELRDSRELFDAVLKAMADMVLVFDDQGRLIYYHLPPDNELVLPQERWLGLSYREVMPAELGASFDEALDCTRLGRVATLEYSLETRRGLRWFSAQISPSLDCGRYQGAVAVVRDIDDHKRALGDLKLAGMLFDAAIEGVCICAADGTILTVNPAFSAITGYTAEEVVGRNPRLLKSDRHDAAFYERLWRELRDMGHWQGEIWNRRKDGEIYPEFLSINAVSDSNEHLSYYVGVFSDLSAIKLRDDLIRHQTYHDPLTGLPNRDLFEDRLSAAIAQYERQHRLFAVVMLSIENFRQVNSTLGHVVGDQLLCEVAARLRQCVRAVDTVARMGAERFVMLLLPTGAGVSDVLAAVGRLRESFGDPVQCFGHEVFVSINMGLALYPADGHDNLTLLKHADLAIQHARGRNACRFYSDEMNVTVCRRLELETELHHALEQQQFELHYQPVVAACDGRISGAEALIRWRHPQRGLVPPGEFIPLAEENGLITAITEWVIGQALDDLERLAGLSVSVNISARDLEDERIVRLLERRAAAGTLVLELTENTLIERRESVLACMASLRRRGMRFSIDDFGTGYSSLSYLKRFPLDYLKIDRSFVIDLPADEDSSGIARAIIGLGKALNLALVGEGVETREQFDFLVAEGCEFIQGFFFSKPVPIDDFLKLPARFALPA
ncbi:MAG: Cyclic di-GMP phosphodiesterase Gmr [Deltaproteobacteria bacterium ADurb.Bin510]|nr:MAG: Cyclic di-GMP phosphodiesterase Gmr [Deltaproteobacteria bacterium ADurb.Bin510]